MTLALAQLLLSQERTITLSYIRDSYNHRQAESASEQQDRAFMAHLLSTNLSHLPNPSPLIPRSTSALFTIPP